MAVAFRNPSNGHTEVVDGGAKVGVFFFGALYLAYKGLWGHFLIWLLTVGGFAALTGGPGLMIALPLASIAYALFINGILESSYLKKGWIKVSETGQLSSMGERDCPFCAETIKAAAIKCKHCGADVEQPLQSDRVALTDGWTVRIPFKVGPEFDEAHSILSANGYPLLDSEAEEIVVGPFANREEAIKSKKRIGFKYAMHGNVAWVSTQN